MKFLKAVILTLFVCLSLNAEEEQLVMPQWSDEEMEDLEGGALVPGSSLMGSLALERLFAGNREPIEFEEELMNIPGEPHPEDEWPTTIDESYFQVYFRQPPGNYLIDPQNILTPQEKRDREGFLAYHARDSSINIYLYLFDAKQELPEGETAERVMSEHYGESGHSVVVFYFLGIPERTQIVMSPMITETIELEMRKNALIRSVEEALDRSEAVAQIESFSIQLSIRLYWLEKELGHLEVREASVLHPLGVEASEEVGDEAMSWNSLSNSPRVRLIGGGIGILIVTVASALFGKWLVDRKRIYVFPESEGNLLLEAPHAAGVGAVIAYTSATFPPSVQRDEVPDYLQRM
ncbi:MAG: hypothetical protein OSA93_12565 [Akkermansiaceae bacterium]|nr:hypothetical protein [Akkermansiaceae bacterium]